MTDMFQPLKTPSISNRMDKLRSEAPSEARTGQSRGNLHQAKARPTGGGGGWAGYARIDMDNIDSGRKIASSLALGEGLITNFGERGMVGKRHRWSFVAMVFAVVGVALTAPAAVAQSDWLQELEAGCNAGEGQDCANLGGQLRLGHITPKDLPAARVAFEKGCKLDSLNACVELYKALSLGEGGPKDPVRAEQLADKVCDTGIISLDVYLEASGLCIE